MYQWYQNGELVAGETMPYFPYLTENITITELDGEKRIDELVRMLGGNSATVREHARQLLENNK